MLRQSFALFILLVMIAAPVAIMTLPGKTEAGPRRVWSGTEYYKCTQDGGQTCIDISRPYSDTDEPWYHRVFFHSDHDTYYVNRDRETTDRVTSCSGCCAPW